MADSIQPEDVYYYPKKITLRKNWDIDQEWELTGTPVDLQKPNEIKKNKPKNRDRNAIDDQEYDEDEYDDENGFNTFDNQGAWGKGSQYNNAGRSNSSNGNRGRGGVRNARNY